MPPPGPGETGSVTSNNTNRRGAPVFSLDTFSSNDFIVKDIIESLSDSVAPLTRRSTPATTQAAFDPKPLIRSFEAALQQISTLSETLESRENELSSAVRQAELQHKQTSQNLSGKLQDSISQFNRLEASLSTAEKGISSNGVDVGDALRIGERLEELEKQRTRAQDARFLIRCWMEVSERGSLSSLEDMRRMGGSDGKVKCAHIARQLLRISHRLGPEQTAHTNGFSKLNGTEASAGKNENAARETIERFLEGLETDLLNQFDDHYRRQNFQGMRECAVALKDFNDGASVMGLFVNQHQFFIDRSQLVTEDIAGDGDVWDRIADPDTEPPGVDQGLQSLVDEVRLVVQEESFIIKQAFPYHDDVLARFLQRVFQQSIQQRLEQVLEKADSISTLAFLRALQASRAYISTLVEDLKAHGLTEHPEPPSSQIIATLDQQLDELFVPYFVGTSYIEREKKNLEELYSSLLFKFTTYHSRRKKTPTTYLDRLGQRGRELISTARDAYMERLESTDLSVKQKAMLLRIAGLKDTDANRREAEIEVTEQDGALSVATAKRMLKWLAEAVGRGLELSSSGNTSVNIAATSSSSTDSSKDMQTLLGLLLTHMGDIYLDSALDAFAEAATSQESAKAEPDFTYLAALRPAIQILHILQSSIQTLLIPLQEGGGVAHHNASGGAPPNGLNGAVSNQRRRAQDITHLSTLTISTLEQKLSLILHRTIEASLQHTSRLLSTLQKKTDFRPPPTDLTALEALQTPACAAIYTFLSGKVEAQATRSLDGANRRMFLGELAAGLRGLLLEHLRRFVVSSTGGVIVRKDVTKYVDLVRGWGLTNSSAAAAAAAAASTAGRSATQQPPLAIGQSSLASASTTDALPTNTPTAPQTLTPFELEGGMEILIEVANLFVIGPVALKERLSGVKAGGGAGGDAARGAEDVAELKKYVERREDVGSVGVQAVLNSV